MQSKTSALLINLTQNLTQLILAVAALTAGLTFALPALADSAPAADSAWHLQTGIQNLLAQVQSWGAAGAAAFVALYVLATLLFVPGLLLTLGAGFIYGVAQGTLYVMLGASLGAILAFLTGRYLARSWVSRQLQSYPKFKAIDRAVERQGLKIVLLARLSPLLPFNLLNYGFGITSVSLRDYALGCWGMLPGTLLYVYLGSLAGSLATLNVTSSPNPALQWGIQGLGLAATPAIALYGAKIAQQALAESADSPADSQAGES